MTYDVLVTINNSPTKVKKWGYLIKADSREEAKKQALEYARNKANTPYSRYKKCEFTVLDKDINEKPDW